MRPGLRHFTRTQQGYAHDAIPNHQRAARPLFLGERQELRRKLARRAAIERDIVQDPETVEDGK